jgi:hypothetical protein
MLQLLPTGGLDEPAGVAPSQPVNNSVAVNTATQASVVSSAFIKLVMVERPNDCDQRLADKRAFMQTDFIAIPLHRLVLGPLNYRRRSVVLLTLP